MTNAGDIAVSTPKINLQSRTKLVSFRDFASKKNKEKEELEKEDKKKTKKIVEVKSSDKNISNKIELLRSSGIKIKEYIPDSDNERVVLYNIKDIEKSILLLKGIDYVINKTVITFSI